MILGALIGILASAESSVQPTAAPTPAPTLAPSSIPITWNPADAGNSVVFPNAATNDYLTAAATVNSMVRATQGISSGQLYWENTTTNISILPILGVATITAPLNGYPGKTGTSAWGYYGYNGSGYPGIIENNDTTRSYGLPWGDASTVIGILLDMDAGTMTVYKNSVSMGVAVTGLTGTVYPAMGGASPGGYSNVTTNFSAVVPTQAPTAAPTPAPVAATTWNPTDKGLYTVLSNNNLTTVSNYTSTVRSTVGVSTGKHYFEVTSTNGGLVGVGTASAPLAGTAVYPGGNAESWSLYWYNGAIYHNNSETVYHGDAIGSAVVGIKLDMDAGTLSFVIGGIDKGIAVGGLSGLTLYAMAGGGSSGSPDTTTANFGASAFTYAVPAGYQAGFGAGTV